MAAAAADDAEMLREGCWTAHHSTHGATQRHEVIFTPDSHTTHRALQAILPISEVISQPFDTICSYNNCYFSLYTSTFHQYKILELLYTNDILP